VTAAIARSGDEAMRSRWAKSPIAGEALGGFSLTEPQAGSDAARPPGVEPSDRRRQLIRR